MSDRLQQGVTRLQHEYRTQPLFWERVIPLIDGVDQSRREEVRPR